MSVNGLQQQYIPPTLDGLNVVEADQIYIDGTLVDLDSLVPYTGASKMVDLGAQKIRSTWYANNPADLINKNVLDTTVSNLTIAISGTFLDKITSTAQTVASKVQFQDVITFDQQAVLQSGLKLNASPSGNWTITTEYIDSFTQNLVFTGSGGGVFRLNEYAQPKSSGWSPSKVPIFSAQGYLVSSGVDSVKIDYLDNVSSDIQSQLNSKLNLSGSNANQTLNMGSYAVQSSYVPVGNTDLANKLYVDNAVTGVGLFVKKVGDTMSGTLDMGANTVITTRTPVSADDLTRKGYVDTGLSLKGNLSGGNTWYGAQQLPTLTASRVLVLDGSNSIATSNITTTTLTYLDVGSSITGLLALKADLSYVDSQDTALQNQINLKANSSDVTTALALKADLSYVNSQDTALQNQINLKANSSDVTTALALKADLSYVNSQDTALQNQINLKANSSDVTAALALKADLSYVNSQDTALQNQINLKANSSDVTSALALKAGLADTQTFTGVNTFSNTVNLSGYTASRVLQLDASRNIQTSSVTTTELGYVSGVTSGIQSQINAVVASQANYVLKAGDLMTGSLRFSNNIVTEWGSGVVGKEPNAGKIGYGWVSATGLDIVGGGTTAGQRAVICYDRLGVGVAPTTAFQVSGVGSISGNVGIGTTNPLSLLHLNSVGTHQVRFQTSAPDNHYITAANDLFAFNANLSLTGIPNVGRGSCQIILQTPTAGGFIQFMTGSAINTVPSERMRLTGDGNLGIGSTTPRARLDVAGDIITDWNSRRIGTQFLTTTSGYYLGMITDTSTRTLYLDSQSADVGGSGAVVIRTGATPAERIRVDASGQMASGVAGNTLYNLKLANSLSHIDNNAGEVYLFTAYQGHLAIGRNTNRDSSTTNLVLGAASTEEAQIISVNTDNTAYKPMSFAATTYYFGSGNMGIGLPSSGGYRVPIAKFTINSNYSHGDTGGFAINAYDGSNYSLRLFPYVQAGGQVGYQFKTYNQGTGYDSLSIGYNGFVGIGTNTPGRALDVFGASRFNNALVVSGLCSLNGGMTPTTIISTTSDYTNTFVMTTPWPSITFDNSVLVSGGRKWSILCGGPGAHVGEGNFGIFDITAGAYRFSIDSDGISKFHKWIRVDNGDISTCVYGPNSTWNARLRVGSGTSDYDAATAQIIATNGTLHLDPGYGKDFYLGYYNDQAASLGTNFIYGDVQLRHKLTVGAGTSRTLMSVSGGSNGGANRFGPVTAWDVNANGCLYTQDQPSGANSAGMFQGYNGANLAGYTTVLAPNIAWLTYFIYASDTQVFYNGALSAYTQAGGWVNVSDEREKEDIQDLKTESSLQRVLALRPKHYRRKYPVESATPIPQTEIERRHVGFIAQEVQESNPHCVSTWYKEEAKSEEDDGVRLGMSYNDYVVHLVGAVQEQQKQIELLSQRNQILENHARKLEQDFADYRTQTESRFDKLAMLITSLK